MVVVRLRPQAWLNQVRERAFGDSNHNYATVTLDDILLERRLELSWEMHNRRMISVSGPMTKVCGLLQIV